MVTTVDILRDEDETKMDIQVDEVDEDISDAVAQANLYLALKEANKTKQIKGNIERFPAARRRRNVSARRCPKMRPLWSKTRRPRACTPIRAKSKAKHRAFPSVFNSTDKTCLLDFRIRSGRIPQQGVADHNALTNPSRQEPASQVPDFTSESWRLVWAFRAKSAAMSPTAPSYNPVGSAAGPQCLRRYPPAEPRRPTTVAPLLKPRRGGDASRDPHAKRGA